jgi:hypothetical protein
METLLDQYVDTPTSAIWHKLANPKRNLSDDERAQVAVFIAFMFTRTSAMRRMLTEIFDDVGDKVSKLLDQLDDPDAQPPARLPPIPGAYGYSIGSREDLEALRPTHNDFVSLMPTAVDQIAAILTTMNWTVLRSPTDWPFITSDNPVVRDNSMVDNPYHRADLLREGAEVSIPIDKYHLLVCSRHGPTGHYLLSPEIVDAINRRAIAWSEAELYSSRRERWIDKEFYGRKVRARREP